MANTDKLEEIVKNSAELMVAAEIAETLSGGKLMQQFIQAALQSKVKGPGYRDEEKPLLKHLVEEAVKEQAKAVVVEQVHELEPQIREEVRKALQESVGVIADSLVEGFVESAKGAYPRIEVRFDGRD